MIATKPRILCVDDEPDVLKFLEAVLVPNGYEVTKAEDGEEALEKLKGERIDLVLSDVTMPKLDGFEVCRRIKADDRYRNIPVVIITGLAAKQDRIKGIDAGAEDFISKPIDPAEVLARIKMLLKAKELHEKQSGELFIEMGFITKQQLQEALRIAKKENIKVGEALYSMGALDKDHIYWMLSNQLNMNYVELSPEMIDRELIGQFSIEILEQLQCLPLYETMEEIHFTIADPTDQKIVERVKSLRPEKVVQLHLALPEKIMDILNLFQRDFYSKSQPHKIIQPEEKDVYHPPAKIIESSDISKIESYWSDLVDLLLSMSQSESYWFYRTPHKCHLMSQRDKKFETVREYSEGIYLLIKERLKQNRKETPLFLHEKSTERQGAFKLTQMDCLDRDMIKIERIPTFSQEKFMMSHPKASDLIENLQRLFSEHRRLLIGGKDRLFVKQCCYSLLKANDHLTSFPPPFFVEGEIEIYFPGVAQLFKHQFNHTNFLECFKEEHSSFVFYEAELPETTSDEKYLSKFLSGVYKNIILFFPFHSLEAIKKALSVYQDWHRAGFKAIFFDQYQWKSI
jgi:CheY-like chemotaxis protein